MNKYLKVKSDVSLVRDIDSNAIISQNQSEYDKFVRVSQKKYEEKRKFDNMRKDLDSLKTDMEEIKTLLKNIMNK
ncbi:uncharacterized protein METZ01_LOCUS415181 [marine metagenome]|uniref:Uncharacterized protein n=1 Tax=marine metagenome TaxID=408172 RepID=A0A382WU09_9ZZZZ